MKLNCAVTTTFTALLLTSVYTFADIGVEGEDYACGEVIVKFIAPITLTIADGIFETGLSEIDNINSSIGVSNIELVSPLLDEPLDITSIRKTLSDVTASYYNNGLDRIYWVEFDETVATVSNVIAQYEATDLVEYAEPNFFYDACVTTPNDEYFDQQW